jgi:hypothetical protein
LEDVVLIKLAQQHVSQGEVHSEPYSASCGMTGCGLRCPAMTLQHVRPIITLGSPAHSLSQTTLLNPGGLP